MAGINKIIKQDDLYKGYFVIFQAFRPLLRKLLKEEGKLHIGKFK